ncbi:AAA family ATPase [Paucibacter sp. PLA-PC-4]|uniref:AAA family ATPase n=1 Tax=Paucibacter sp. PLA-PC-4 TaxID=2993655 RepID=UPI002248A9D0|nr:AAA family ATPase [Paucibacter sp. PLA-PC-4]MCX2862258.1 AAA family ATPase [Paucibacter sp. PLA-PC-4]
MDRSIDQLLDNVDWEGMKDGLTASALGDQCPVDVVLQQLGSSIAGAPAQELVDAIERKLDSVFLGSGIERCRRIVRHIPSSSDHILKTVYFRRTEYLATKALADSHPVILATTVETERFVQAIHRHCEREPKRDLWIWRGAAGKSSFERAVDTRDGKQFQFSFALMSEQTDPDEAATMAELVMKQGVLQDHRKRWFRFGGGTTSRDLIYHWREEPGKVQIVVDDRDGRSAPNQAILNRIHNEIRKAMAGETSQEVSSFIAAIYQVARLPANAVCLIPDAHHFLRDNPLGGRFEAIGALKQAYHDLIKRDGGQKLYLLAADAELPDDLREELNRIDLPLPGRLELFVSMRDVLIPRYLPDSIEGDQVLGELCEEAAGMTLGETRAVLKRAIQEDADNVTSAELMRALRGAKKRHVARSAALQLLEPERAIQLGGMECFDEWLHTRYPAFSAPERARSSGIDRLPRGVLLLGIPGSGKSLAAKVTAHRWNLPLVRMDLSSLRHKWVGSSEARARQALKVVEAMAPCVLWIDEIDKGLASSANTSSSTSDLNIKGLFLTWMQENRYPVFVVATANQYNSLPPEVTRAGRFDARFFFGCPGKNGRRVILKGHLRNRGYDPDQFDIDAVVERTHGFTGAEIEQVVLDSLYIAFAKGGSVGSSDLLDNANAIKPLIKSAGSELNEIWKLVEQGRVQPASDDMLTLGEVAALTDPYLYRPVYCQLEKIEGFEKQCAAAARILMRSPFAAPAAAVMETADPEWIYIQTNITRNPRDVGHFKLLDRFETIQLNTVVDSLVGDYALETIYFESVETKKRFEESATLSAYADIFADA